jgi:phosphomannomutase
LAQDGWRAIIGKDFITENVARVAKATADWVLQHNSNPAIAVGFDCRFGGSLFAQTAINVFLCAQHQSILRYQFCKHANDFACCQ